MKDNLTQYVNLLFAGTADCEAAREEVLRTAHDRYDRLISSGCTPEDAYRQTISGIGNISDLLVSSDAAAKSRQMAIASEEAKSRRFLRIMALVLYILCPIPLMVSAEMGMQLIGLPGTLFVAGLATAMKMVGAEDYDPQSPPREETPMEKKQKSLGLIIHGTGVVLYLLLSFTTLPRYIPWTVFPATAAVYLTAKHLLSQKTA